jgi:DNA-binding GntR family transcriptional regulator
MVAADMAFHLALVSATGCKRLRQWADGVLLELRLVLSVLDRDQERLEAQAEEHAELLELLRSQPPARALDAVTRHLTAARAQVAASLDGLAARTDAQP